MSDDVRQAAKALFDLGAANGGDPGTFDRDSAEIRAYLDRVFDKAWESSPLRAALASGERGVPVAWGVLDSHGDMPNVYVEREKIDAALARLNVIGRTGPYRVVPLYAAPAENDAGRGEIEKARRAFHVAAENYARCYWGDCPEECHEHEGEVDDEVHAENETHYRDAMRDAWTEYDDATRARGG